MKIRLVLTALVLAISSPSFASNPQPAASPPPPALHVPSAPPHAPAAIPVVPHAPAAPRVVVPAAPEASRAGVARVVVARSTVPDVVAAHATMRQELRSAAIVSEKSNAAHGVNASSIVTIARPGGGTIEAIMKPAAGSRTMARIDPATMGIREAAASTMADSLGLDFVPPTTLREHHGTACSVQLMAKNTTSALKFAQEKPGAQLDRGSAEKVRVFDYLTGNVDRHPNNLLVEERDGRYFPVAIDNGLTFPVGPTKGGFFWPKELTSTHKGPLLSATVDFIQAIDAAKLAGTLKAAGIEREATVHVLRRLEHLKREPNLLAIPDDDDGKIVTAAKLANHPLVAMKSLKWDGNTLVPVGKEAHKKTQELPDDVLAQIDNVVDAQYR